MPVRLNHLLGVGLLSLAGCGAPAEVPATAASGPALPVAGAPSPDSPAPQAVPQLPVEPKPVEPKFTPPTLPNDLAGKAVVKSLMPRLPDSPLPTPPVAQRPRPETSLDRGELPLPKIAITPQPTPAFVKGKAAALSPPPERAPVGLGDAAALPVGTFSLPERPLLKGNNAANPAAPDLPAMARQLPDRAPTDDPTVELSAKGVIQTPLPHPVFALPYLREVLPNPFEFAEQLRGKLGRDTELGTAPAIVNPEKK